MPHATEVRPSRWLAAGSLVLCALPCSTAQAQASAEPAACTRPIYLTFDTGHMGRNRVHQHGGRVRCLAAGHINADAIQRHDLLAEHGAIGFGVLPGALTLMRVIATNAVGGDGERLLLVCRQALVGGLEARQCDAQSGHIGNLNMIEAIGVVDDSGIAIAANAGDDLIDRGLHGRVRHAFPGQQLIQRTTEVGILAVVALHHRHVFSHR